MQQYTMQSCEQLRGVSNAAQAWLAVLSSLTSTFVLQDNCSDLYSNFLLALPAPPSPVACRIDRRSVAQTCLKDLLVDAALVMLHYRLAGLRCCQTRHSISILAEAQASTMAAGSKRHELKQLLLLAAPTILQSATQQAMLVTDRIFVGRLLGTTEMAAAALGNAYCNVSVLFLLGAATALDTLGATAHGAARSKVPGAIRLASWTATAAIVLTGLCLLSMASLTVAGPFVHRVLHQDEEISQLVKRFCLGLMPSICPMTWGTILMKYLQVQGVVVSPALIVLASFGINIGANMVLIDHMGFMGAPLATSFAQLMQCVGLAGMVLAFKFSRPRRTARIAQQQQEEQQQEQTQPHLLASTLSQRVRHWLSKLGARIEDWLFYGAQDIQLSDQEGCATDSHEPQYSTQTSSLNERAASSSGSSSVDIECAKPVQHFCTADVPTLPWSIDQTGAGYNGSSSNSGGSSSRNSHCGHEGAATVKPLEGGLCLVTEAGGALPRHARIYLQLPSSTCVPQEQPGKRLWPSIKSAFVSGAVPSNLWTFVKLCMPGGLLLVVEYVAFDILLAMAAQLGDTTLAAHSVMDAIVTFTYMSFPYAIGVAASIRVGHLLGQGDTSTARTSAYLSLALGGGFMTCCAAAIYFARAHVGYLFTSDEEVVALVAGIAPLAALFQVADGAWGTAAGVLRGCGRQTQLMIFSAVGFWGGGVLVGALLCFKAGKGLQGLWWGLVTAELVITALCSASLWRVSWVTEGTLARQRSLGKQRHAIDASASSCTSFSDASSNSSAARDAMACTRSVEIAGEDSAPNGTSMGLQPRSITGIESAMESSGTEDDFVALPMPPTALIVH